MSRSLLVLLLITAGGVAAGFFLQKNYESATASTGKKSATGKLSAQDLAPLTGMDPNASPAGEGGDLQVNILQSQIEYLEEQNQLLQSENSQLIDQLAALRGKPGGSTSTPTPSPAPMACAPDASTEKGSAPDPDFAGIGMELLKIRGITDIPIPTALVPPAEVEKRISKWLSTQFAADHGRKQGRALAALGAIPRPVDTIALKAAFLSYQIGGWYDASDATLYLAQGVDAIGPAKENAMALSYGYLFKQKGSTLFPPNTKPLTLDARLGRESILAGDAAQLRFLHALQNPATGGGGGVGEDPDDPSRLVPIPNFLRELELLPFSMGLDFMQAMHSIGNWEQVDATYTRPPISSAELLDSQVYLQDVPFSLLPLEWPDISINGAQPFWNDTLGPIGVVLLLKQHIPEPVAAETVPGWLNDRLMVYENQNPGRDHVVWQSLWRDSNAADAFFGAMRTFVSNRLKDATPNPEPSAGVFQLEHKGRIIRLTRTHGGKGVLYVDAADLAVADEAFKKLSGS
ncbi:hypothetical protein FEM03_15010 [Phragmitibacter flavus]|uniref:Uncharacterized protein n=1 Tax=Phragmitibacter flavus TaxID=2576071 RepID=A0A5R8KCJ6_9BACT|nr:hypothetical protein [Phragmitibacter flavus]TLD70036.1 hypothetical protein FEM03_15010 [Phragmitibacter flavus]